jgi:hypothetical protein
MSIRSTLRELWRGPDWINFEWLAMRNIELTTRQIAEAKINVESVESFLLEHAGLDYSEIDGAETFDLARRQRSCLIAVLWHLELWQELERETLAYIEGHQPRRLLAVRTTLIMGVVLAFFEWLSMAITLVEISQRLLPWIFAWGLSAVLCFVMSLGLGWADVAKLNYLRNRKIEVLSEYQLVFDEYQDLIEPQH